MKKNTLPKNPFTDEFDETSCIEYYVGVEGRTIERITCPEHIWEVLDNMHSMVMNEDSLEGEEQNFLLSLLSDLMDDVEPYTRETLM